MRYSISPLYAFLLCTVLACNSADVNEQSSSTADTTSTSRLDSLVNPSPVDTASFEDPGYKVDTSHGVTIDSATTVEPTVIKKEIKKKSAELGFSYYTKMKRGETKIFRVYVSINHPEAVFKTYVRDLERKEMERVKEDDTSSILTVPVNIYKYLSVSLDYDKEDFEITALENARQEIDTVEGNQWHFRVKAISPDKRRALITMKAEAESPEGKPKLKPTLVQVEIKFGFWDMVRGWLYYLGDHPEYTIPSVVVPLIIFGFNRRRKKKETAA